MKSGRIAVSPEPLAAIGPIMNLVGICQELREHGHDCPFILDPGLLGTAAHPIDALLRGTW